MAKKPATVKGTPNDPWVLKTPPLTSEFTMHRDVKDGKDVLVCTVGKTVLLYDARCLDDLHKMLKKHGDWMELGSADEQKDAKDGTVEAWGRSSGNPIGGAIIEAGKDMTMQINHLCPTRPLQKRRSQS